MTARSDSGWDPVAIRPWWLGEGRRGILLLHGFSGTPPELRRLGEHLAVRGWRCYAPAMAGHATTPEDLGRTTWRDWAESARRAFAELVERCDVAAIAGQSMGGAMALHLAANDPRVAAVASLATPMRLHNWRVRLLPVAKYVVRWHEPDPDDVDLGNPEAVHELYSYARRPTRAILELSRLLATVRAELAMVRAPTIVLQGGRDRTVDPEDAVALERRLVCSAAVERHLLPDSGHGMSVDVDRDEVNRMVAEFLDRWVPARSAQPSGPAARAAG